jgi:DNA repair exonuclease SbcCD nuclease subunit
MAKVVFFSDLHLHNWANSATVHESGLNSRLADQLTVLAQINDYCKKHEVDAVVFGGDFFHSRTKLDVDVLFCAQLAVRALVETVKEVYLLVGNHDQAARDGSIHSLDTFKGYAHVIDKPQTIHIARGELKMTAHPFTTDTDAFIEFCKNMEPCDIFLAHQGISEALVGAYEVPLKADIPLSALPHDRAGYLFLGHYHKHQSLGSAFAYYIGSPLQLDFGERNEEKGFLVLDTESSRNAADWSFEFVPTVAPSFKLYETPADFEAAVKKGKVNPEKDFIRVHGPSSKCKKLQDRYPRIHTVAEALVEKTAQRIDTTLAASDRDLLNAYVERAEVKLDKQRLVELGLRFLEER